MTEPAAELDAELLLDPAVQADPFAYYQQLRAQQPVLRMPGTGFYVLTRYEDLRMILRDTETFSNTMDLEEQSGDQGRRLGALFLQRLAEQGRAFAGIGRRGHRDKAIGAIAAGQRAG